MGNAPLVGRALQLVRLGNAAEAITILSTAIRQSSTATMLNAALVEARIALGDRKGAIIELKKACQSPIEEADLADALGFYARQLDQHELSNLLYNRAVELAPQTADFWFNLATSERSLGRLDEAHQAIARAISIQPDHRPAILMRSEVKKAVPSSNHVDDLRRRIDQSPDGSDAMIYYYALGKELHDLAEYDDAFVAFSQGARIRRRHLQYDVAADEMKFARIREAFDSEPPDLVENPGQHVFIVGLPRSGTTLTERILGGLDNVRSNNETNNFSNALLSAAAGEGDVFDRCAAADFRRVAREYDKLAVPDEFSGKVIEKLPFNYLYIGAIWRAFRGAPIIWVRRNPVDNCFAMFRTLFGAAYPFSYDFSDLARYYAAYARLMAHWDELRPEVLIKIDYEALVTSPETVGPELAKRCAMEWRPEALDLNRNNSASLTASAAQVRGEIYSSSKGLWRNYERHLGPLIDELDRNGVPII